MRTPLVLALIALTGCASTPRTNYEQPSPDSPAPAAPAAEASPRAPDQPAASPSLAPGQPSFASTDEAVQALYGASSRNDLAALCRILGLPESDLATTDPVRNASIAHFFAQRYDEFHNVVPEAQSDGSLARVFIGKENLALASQLVKADGRWFFDSAGGRQALISRYIDENQRATIGVCRAYVQAQYEYYAEDRNGDDVLEYAQQLGSTRGTHNGLYWHTEPSEPESPLGPLIAQARASGYLRAGAHNTDEPVPYHGYYFKILTRQGPHAPGGEHDYIINGHMVAGFALVAYPAHYGRSGVETFLVGANGKVLEKDLGPDTPRVAGDMNEYDPDASWTVPTE
jgi:hypothetical protein